MRRMLVSEVVGRGDAGAGGDPRGAAKNVVTALTRREVVRRMTAPGYSAQSRFIGWSMSKSVMSALVGILVSQDRLTLESPAPVPEWANPADPRHAITLDQLLHMSSGLEFDEDYHSPLSDVVWLSTVPAMVRPSRQANRSLRHRAPRSTTPAAPRRFSPGSSPREPENPTRGSQLERCLRRSAWGMR